MNPIPIADEIYLMEQTVRFLETAKQPSTKETIPEQVYAISTAVQRITLQIMTQDEYSDDDEKTLKRLAHIINRMSYLTGGSKLVSHPMID